MKTRILTLLTIAAIPLAAQGRLIALWPYDKLLEKSDLVVMATVDSVAGFDGAVEIPQFADVLEPQVTTFKVQGVIQGDYDGETLGLVHCRMKDDNVGVRNGPLLADFEAGGRTIRIESGEHAGMLVQESEPSYLLFLKRREDGRFEPVAGQVDSSLSVRRVTSAFGF